MGTRTHRSRARRSRERRPCRFLSRDRRAAAQRRGRAANRTSHGCDRRGIACRSRTIAPISAYPDAAVHMLGGVPPDAAWLLRGRRSATEDPREAGNDMARAERRVLEVAVDLG